MILSLARYTDSILTIVVPILWLKKRYGLNKENLGLKKGNLNLLATIVVGIGIAIIYYFLILPLFFKFVPTAKISYAAVIFAPISINGFPV